MDRSTDPHDSRDPDSWGHDSRDHGSWDEALARLEDVLQAAPFDRALPDLGTILERARISDEFLREDDRALKVLHEAIVARPLSSAEAIIELRTEVDLLALEVEVLTDRLADPTASAADVEQASARLRDVRAALDQIRDVL